MLAIIIAALALAVATWWLLTTTTTEASAPVAALSAPTSSAPTASAAQSPAPKSPPLEPPSSVPIASSPAAKGIADAARTGTNPERLSMMFEAPSFDPAAYAKDPAAYCAEVVPGRVTQVATPGPDVKPLLAKSPITPELRQGGSQKLAVASVPHAPVTFVAKDGGYFAENGLNCITVQADAEGLAFATYVADKGTIAMAQVMAGSPLASGTILFHLLVHHPDGRPGIPMPATAATAPATH